MANLAHTQKSVTKDREGKIIEVGDHIDTRVKLGRSHGEVDDVVQDAEEAAEKGIHNPPKVIYHDQLGNRIVQNPRTVTVTDEDKRSR